MVNSKVTYGEMTAYSNQVGNAIKYFPFTKKQGKYRKTLAVLEKNGILYM